MNLEVTRGIKNLTLYIYYWLKLKIKCIFGKKSSTQKYTERVSFLYIYSIDNWLFVFKIKGIFGKKSPTQKYAEKDSFLYI